MQYVFSPDGQDFVWLDAHGLTRVLAGKRQKTDYHAEGGYLGNISRSAAGDKLLVSEGQVFSDKAFLYDLPALSRPTTIKHTDVRDHTLHPDGQGFLLGARGLYRQGWKILRWAFEETFGNSDSLTDIEATTPDRGTHPLSATTATENLWTAIVFNIHDDCTFLVMDRDRHCVFGGRIPSIQATEAHWKMTVPTHPNHLINLHPQQDWSLIVAFDGVERVNRVLAIPEEGEPVTFTVAGVGRLQRAGDVLAVQRDERTVVELSLAEAIAGEPKETAYTLTGTPWQIDGRPLRAQNAGAFYDEAITEPLWDVGLGDVLLHEDALWFVPWHGEVFCNLRTGARLARRLPGDANQIAARRFIVARYARLREVGQMTNHFYRLQKIRFKKKNRFEMGSFNCPGVPSPTGRMVTALREEISDDPRWRTLHGWCISSQGGARFGENQDLTLEEAEEIARFSARERIPARTALWLLHQYFQDLEVEEYPPEDLPKPMSLGAQQVLLWMSIEGYRRDDVDIIAELPKWASTPITTAFLDKHFHEVKAVVLDSTRARAFQNALEHYFARQGKSVRIDI